MPEVNVRDLGARGDGVTDDAPAIQRAIDGLTNGGTCYFPPGNYLLDGSGAELLLVSRGIILRGSGSYSVLLVKSSVGPNTDVIRIKPSGFSGASFPEVKDQRFFGLRDLMIQSQLPGNPARHAVVLDITAVDTLLVRFEASGCYFGALGGRSIVFNNPSGINVDGGVVTSSIHNCLLMGGILLVNAGDTINVYDCTFRGTSGAFPAIEGNLISGASTLNITGCNITSKGGVHLTSGTMMSLTHNIIEAYLLGTVGSNGAMVDLDGASGPIRSPVIAHNVIGSLNGTNLDAVRLNQVYNADIHNNFFNIPTGKVGVRPTSSTQATEVVHCVTVGGGVSWGIPSPDPFLHTRSPLWDRMPAPGYVDQGSLTPEAIRPGSINLSTQVVTSNITLTNRQTEVLVDCSTGNLIVTLPPIGLTTYGRLYFIKKIDPTLNTVTVVPSSATIEGLSSYTLSSQYKSVTLVASNHNPEWYVQSTT